ncbi:hypothetical protein ACIBUR_06750 [Streptomyces anulatus]
MLAHAFLTHGRPLGLAAWAVGLVLGIRRSSQQSMFAQLLDVQLGEDEAGSVLQRGEQVDLPALGLGRTPQTLALRPGRA